MQTSRIFTPLIALLLSAPTLGNTLWQTQGYGYIIDVNETNITFYDTTKKHCLKNSYHSGKYTSHDFKRLSTDSAQFNIGAVHPLQLSQIKELPAMCQLSATQTFNAPDIFEVYGQTFSEHYAFSQQIDWHWRDQYKGWRAKVNDKTTPKDLVAIIKDLMGHINDGHAFLYDADGGITAYVNPKDTLVNNRVRTAFKAQSEIKLFRTFFNNTVDLTNNVTKSYFDPQVKAQMLHDNFWLAKLPGNLSYLHIEDMSGFGSDDESLETDLTAVDDAMKTIVPAFNRSKGLVLDLRWNGGGEDLVSMRLLSYLIDKTMVVSRKFAKTDNGFTKPKDIVAHPAKGNNYLGPIVVLTSEATASAAESFALGLVARGNVTFIGAASNGAYSDMLMKQLPNGWTFSLSNETYVDLAGKSYESIGYPVSQSFDYFDAKALEEGKDFALEAAITILGE